MFILVDSDEQPYNNLEFLPSHLLFEVEDA